LQEAFAKLCRNPEYRPYYDLHLDSRFKKNYNKWYSKDGWVDAAWVNFMKVKTSDDDDYFGVLTEKLVDSVHRFSKKPIVVVNFNDIAPQQLDPVKYPNLVLFHARGYDFRLGLSFNFNKLRAALMAKVKVGASLDSDMMMVGPQSDNLLARTKEEITKSYPYPILPTHFLTRDPREREFYKGKAGNFLEYNCDGCPDETMRWGQAQPTWTFWSMPFLAKWLNARTTHMIVDGVHAGTISEDEDLLNVALWKEKATKQWCMYQMGGTSFVWENYYPQHAPGPYPFYEDPRSYPNGVPIAFYFSHAEKKIEKVDKALSMLQMNDDKNTPRPNYMYHNKKFYGNFTALKNDDPDLKCLL